MDDQGWAARCAEAQRLARSLETPDEDDLIRWALAAARAWGEVAACAHGSGDVAVRENALVRAAMAFQQLAERLQAEKEEHPLVDISVVSDGILVAWAAGRDDVAAALGRLPTQRYRPRGRGKPDEPLMFATFALASAARGNVPARDRAIANAREAIAAGRTADLTRARGLLAPLLDALEAVARGRTKPLDRALAKLVRYHRWRCRDAETAHALLDVTATGLGRWAARQGVPSGLVDPLVAPLEAAP
jgi:hypothetical protein